jgi:DNA-binding Lrp family transcriptional regulator
MFKTSSDAAPDMSVDWEIFRSIYRAAPSPNWQAVARPDIPSIARSAKVSTNTVWRKLKDWRKIGFLAYYQYIPNPHLLGVGLEVVRVLHDSEVNRQLFLQRLGQVDGVFFAELSWGARTAVAMVADGSEGRAERIAALSSTRGVTSVAEPMSVWLPSPTRRFRRGEVQLIATLRKDPFASWADLARECRVPRSTVARRYHALRSANVMLTFRAENFSCFPTTVGLLGVSIASGYDPRELVREIQLRIPSALEVPSMWHPPYARGSRLGFAVECKNLWQLVVASADCGRVRGVRDVELRLHLAQLTFGGWFDRAVANLNSSNPTSV